MNAGDPIAVIGMACRFPGAETPEAFAEMLMAGRACVAPFPAHRRKLWAGSHPGAVDLWPAIHARHAGLLDDITRFDRRPFRISANEAPLIDPQQRLVLETGWHALEDAGRAPARLTEAPIGVFVGAASSDYAMLMARAGMAATGNPYLPNGGQNGAIAGRVSYCLGLTGPSYTVDTACSSALAAVALAGDALQSGQCGIALAGGVNALLSQDVAAALCAGPVLTDTGQTRSFDAAASGFVRAEGCGIVVLQRLSDAVAAGERIHAVLTGWATGQDGRTNGLSAPSRQGQARVIRSALARGGASINDVGYVEAHGSATMLGDVIEMSALGDVFAHRSGPACCVGSVKANLGHLEAAAGIAGLIKAILMVRDGFIPAQPCFETPQPRIGWNTLPFSVPRESRNWAADRRLAGVSSFGMSGMNAHLLVGAAHTPRPQSATRPGRPQLFLLSAATGSALVARAKQLSGVVSGGHWPDLETLAAAVGRRWWGLPVRAAFVADGPEDAQTQLAGIAAAPPRRALRAPASLSVALPDGVSPAITDQLRAICPGYRAEAPEPLPPQPQPPRPAEPEMAGRDDRYLILASVAALANAGADIRPDALFPSAGAAGCDLPGYPFERERFWFDDLPNSRAPRT